MGVILNDHFSLLKGKIEDWRKCKDALVYESGLIGTMSFLVTTELCMASFCCSFFSYNLLGEGGGKGEE